MYLKRKGTTNFHPKIEVTFEKMGDKFIMINIKNDYNNILSDSPYYWRLVAENNSPPLEISLNIETGQIQEITLFISDEDFGKKSFFYCKTFVENIIFHTDLFEQYKYFNDSNGKYSVYLTDNNLICLFDNEKPVTEINQNEKISYFLNDKNYLIGFSINNLGNFELNVLFNSNLL